MEFLLLASVTLLIGCGVAALALERPTRIGERAAAGPKTGSAAGRTARSRPPLGRRTGMRPSAAPSAPLGRAPSMSPNASGRHEARPLTCRGESAAEDTPPYSPQELRNLLERHLPAARRAS